MSASSKEHSNRSEIAVENVDMPEDIHKDEEIVANIMTRGISIEENEDLKDVQTPFALEEQKKDSVEETAENQEQFETM